MNEILSMTNNVASLLTLQSHVLLSLVCYIIPTVGSCQHGDEPSGSVQGREFLDQLSAYWLLKEDSAPWS